MLMSLYIYTHIHVSQCFVKSTAEMRLKVKMWLTCFQKCTLSAKNRYA